MSHPSLSVTVVRLVGGPHDGADVLVAGGVLRIELPGSLDHVTRTGDYSGERRVIYHRDSRKQASMAFVGWEGGTA